MQYPTQTYHTQWNNDDLTQSVLNVKL
jgi:hypothetical protein